MESKTPRKEVARSYKPGERVVFNHKRCGPTSVLHQEALSHQRGVNPPYTVDRRDGKWVYLKGAPEVSFTDGWFLPAKGAQS